MLFTQSKFPRVSDVNSELFYFTHTLFSYGLYSVPNLFHSFFFSFYKHKKQQPMHKKIINYMCADVVLTSLYSDRRERMRKNKRRDGIYKKGGRGRQSLAWLVLLLRCCSPFKCNEQSDALQCYVSYVKTEWMETEWKLFLFSMWMKNILFYKEMKRKTLCYEWLCFQ